MHRLELLNLIAAKIHARDYLEIGVAEGNTLANVQVSARTGVDPAPRYYAMDAERLAVLQSLEVHESESDHFFAHNTRTFDLIFVDGLHLYEQAMKDILNALNVLNPGGFVVVHDLIPLEPDHARRDRCTELWNGDVWKVLFDCWRHHPGIGYFVVDSDAGLGVLWKKDEAERFAPGWHEYIRDFGFEVMEKDGPEFLRRVAPVADTVSARLDEVTAEKTAVGYATQSLRTGRSLPHSEAEFLQALDRGDDACWVLEQERYARLDESKIQSNFPLDLYRRTVCANTGGNILRPEKKVYLLHDALLVPSKAHHGKWPHLWNVLDRQGRSMTDLLQRRDGAGPLPAPGVEPERLEGLHVYLGWFAPYFGHFLSEVLPQLWTARLLKGRDVKFVFHADPGVAEGWAARSDDLSQFIREVFAHFGVSFDDVLFVDRPLRVERLVAATPMNRYQRGARQELFDMAREVASLHAGPTAHSGRRLYFSRSSFAGRRFVNGQQIEALFARRGFDIVHPQTMPLSGQISLAAGAEIIAGEEGSALCNAFFAHKPVIIDLESGRFHPNLAKLSYVNSRRYVYLLPYANLEAIPAVRQDSMLYADPWVVDEALCSLFGDEPSGEALCGPRDVSSLLQRAMFLSLAGEPERCMEQLQTLQLKHPQHFAPDLLAHCGANLSQTGISAQRLANFNALGVKLLRAWRCALKAGPDARRTAAAHAVGFA